LVDDLLGTGQKGFQDLDQTFSFGFTTSLQAFLCYACPLNRFAGDFE
jgi:hypothetical protein